MIYELVYTSLPRGLKPGSKGYCTVLTTEGIPSSLQERLEGFSGYRHLFDPGSPQNPVNFMHHRIQIAGNTWHVLSRVADAGSDYSQRSNLFAHHVAISNDELAGIACGPSTLMKHPGFFMTQWEGDPRRVSEAQTRQRLFQLSNQLRVATLWQRLTGNAGFAGVLAKTASDDTSHATSLVYPLGIDILELIDEAMVLLPKHLQWQTTFNSFFTKSIEDCTWRFYCDVAAESRAFSGSAFDLTTLAESEIAIDETEPLVIAAKTGKAAASPTITPSAAKTTFEPTSGRPKLQARAKKEDDNDISKIAKSELREKGKYVDPAFNRSQKSSPPATPQPLKPNHLPIHSVDPYQIIEDSHSRQATLPPLSGNLKNKAPKSKKKSVELNFLPLLSVSTFALFLQIAF
jgi:hypothetical protein